MVNSNVPVKRADTHQHLLLLGLGTGRHLTFLFQYFVNSYDVVDISHIFLEACRGSRALATLERVTHVRRGEYIECHFHDAPGRLTANFNLAVGIWTLGYIPHGRLARFLRDLRDQANAGARIVFKERVLPENGPVPVQE